MYYGFVLTCYIVGDLRECIHGHALTEENTYWSRNRYWCRQCHRDRQARYRRVRGARPYLATLTRDLNYAERNNHTQSVYFISNGMGHVKIGVATDVESRFYGLQVANATELELIAVIPGGYGLEGRIHRLFAQWRIRGEWFDLVPEIKDYLRDLT